jgi:hypothetical protein
VRRGGDLLPHGVDRGTLGTRVSGKSCDDLGLTADFHLKRD